MSPVNVQLSTRSRSAMLTVRNTSEEVLHFQATAFAWDQTADGEMVLSASTDVIFFPRLFTLVPGEERRLRVGTSRTPTDVELTYRIFLEELPSLESPERFAGQVRVLTRVGIPIFLTPARAAAHVRLHGVEMRDGRLTFELANSGTAHFVPRAVRVRPVARAEPAPGPRDLQAWYVLARGTRRYATVFAQDDCRALAAVVVEVETAEGVLSERVEMGPGACPSSG